MSQNVSDAWNNNNNITIGDLDGLVDELITNRTSVPWEEKREWIYRQAEAPDIAVGLYVLSAIWLAFCGIFGTTSNGLILWAFVKNKQVGSIRCISFGYRISEARGSLFSVTSAEDFLGVLKSNLY